MNLFREVRPIGASLVLHATYLFPGFLGAVAVWLDTMTAQAQGEQQERWAKVHTWRATHDGPALDGERNGRNGLPVRCHGMHLLLCCSATYCTKYTYLTSLCCLAFSM